ncbi:glycosyltransferase family 39 protein [Motilimonas sp. KMU-193]|uniref:ArnT family glycosyltransferase n=1 Tax=Motilimonas sp. KMU-193 TaxID=3388668 RepID=UPI00396AF527
MKQVSRDYLILALVVNIVIVVAGIISRPILPLDETRYISVAWEMWSNGEWLVPHINGETYSHKPPLLFWLHGLIWSLFGTGEWVSRLVVPVFVMLNLILVRKLAQAIYPESKIASAISPLILLSFVIWFLYSGMIMFDLILTVFCQGVLLAQLYFLRTQQKRWVWFGGGALGLALLTKGPVILVFFVSFTICSIFWRSESQLRLREVVIAASSMFAIALVVIAAWAVPAAISGGDEYARAIFWGQSVGRVKDSFAHARPFYWYVLLLPAMLFPWFFLSGFWRSKPWQLTDRSDKLCLSFIALVLFVFSCFSGKQPHYLLPMLPVLAVWLSAKLEIDLFEREPVVVGFIALICATMLSAPWWVGSVFKRADVLEVNWLWLIVPVIMLVLVSIRQCFSHHRLALNLVAVLVSLSAAVGSVSPILHNLYDVTRESKIISQLQQQGEQVAYMGKYHNTFAFAGKLTYPLVEVRSDAELEQYVTSTKGYTILVKKKVDQALQGIAHYETPYRGRRLLIIENAQLVSYLAENKR